MATSGAPTVAELAILHVWSEGDLSKIPEYYTEGFVGHMTTPALNWVGATAPVAWRGHEGLRALVSDVRTAFPDYTETPQLVVANGDFIAMRMINRGTHTGAPIAGLEATGRSFEAVDTMFVRLEGGRIAEQWGLIDQFAIGVQVGLLQADPHLLL